MKMDGFLGAIFIEVGKFFNSMVKTKGTAKIQSAIGEAISAIEIRIGQQREWNDE
jgi:hypothetical protein